MMRWKGSSAESKLPLPIDITEFVSQQTCPGVASLLDISAKHAPSSTLMASSHTDAADTKPRWQAREARHARHH